MDAVDCVDSAAQSPTPPGQRELDLHVLDPILKEATEVAAVLRHWEEQVTTPDFDPVPFLTRLAEIIEAETDEYIKLDPDPFDDRHPCRTHPTCALGHSLKVLFKKEPFMSKLVHDYLRETWGGSRNLAVNTAAARLFVDILPGLETSLVYQETEGLIIRLFGWAEDGPEPLRSYSLGLLGASMELPDVASRFKEKNMHLVPIMLRRLRSLQAEFLQNIHRPFAQFSTPPPPATESRPSPVTTATTTPTLTSSGGGTKRKRSGPMLLPELRKRIRAAADFDFVGDEDGLPFPPLSQEDLVTPAPTPEVVVPILAPTPAPVTPVVKDVHVRPSRECSSSSWAVLESNIIGTWKVYPITLATKQIFTLRYLAPLGEYQEMLSFAFESNAVQLILTYLDTKKTKDSRLTFEAIKYLSALLCHKKFALEFINCGGLQKMLEVPRPSIAATGVSLSLYYIAYAEDAMEQVCHKPKALLRSLVEYVMWLMECSHNSGRNHAIMFFGVVYPFKIMLELFDTYDGLRRILNVISTQPNFLSEDPKITEEEILISRQAVRQVTYNLKRYFECHLGFLGQKLETAKAQQGRYNSEPPTPGPDTILFNKDKAKPLQLDDDRVRQLNDLLLELYPVVAPWPPVEKFLRMGGLQTLMQVIALAYDWNYSGRSETVKSVLDVLAICCLFPRIKLQLTEKFTLQGNNLAYGLSMILAAAEGEGISDPDVQGSALMVIGNCVCGSLERPSLDLLEPRTPAARQSKFRAAEENLTKMWECVRLNNGILILTRLLHVKTPITDADSLRALACWCLAGLARYDNVCQVLNKLPLMKNGTLQMLMREPILQEKRHDHVMFQRHAQEIIKLVDGKAHNLVPIHKSSLISQTRIQYNGRQLLQLMHEHLISQGLLATAQSLISEAKLDTPALTTASLPAIATTSTTMTTPQTPAKTIGFRPSTLCVTPTASTSTSTTSAAMTAARNGKFYMNMRPSGVVPGKTVTLDSIVKEYLTNQHALCKTPVAVCPTFDLVVPHRCPAPKARPSAVSFTARFGRVGWCSGTAPDRKLIYSKFKPFRVLRSESEDNFTACAFSPCYQWIIVGTSNGEVKLFNNVSGTEDGTYVCHDGEIYHVEPNRKGNLLLTSNTWRRPMSALWKLESLFDKAIAFESEDYVEFSKVSQDKVIGTQIDQAFVYDIETTKKIYSVEPRMSNQYVKNRATFDPTDHLILNDGVLWDVNGGKEIHKFDKLNENINGVFNPNGLEIICNSEVWDVRTFKLLKTVRALDQSFLTFTNDGNVIYGIKSAKESNGNFRSGDTSFVTLDAGDYSSIGTIELKRSIMSLATSPNDLQIALVENHGATDSGSDSCVRYYEVGRSRYGEDEQVDEEDDDIQSRESDGDGDEDMDDDEDDDDEEDLDRLLDELLPDNDMIEVESSQEDGEGDDTDDGEGEQEANGNNLELSEYEVDDDDDDDDDEVSLSFASTTSDDSD